MSNQFSSTRKTGDRVPALSFNLLDGGVFNSHDSIHTRFTLLTVYRGMWCPHCHKQLTALSELSEKFKAKGVNIVVVSADTQERSLATVNKLALTGLSVGYDIPIESAREFGLFISSKAKDIEMPLFCEPGSFLINSDNKLAAAWLASTAFARTDPNDILSYVDFLNQHSNRVPRGSA